MEISVLVNLKLLNVDTRVKNFSALTSLPLPLASKLIFSLGVNNLIPKFVISVLVNRIFLYIFKLVLTYSNVGVHFRNASLDSQFSM